MKVYIKYYSQLITYKVIFYFTVKFCFSHTNNMTCSLLEEYFIFVIFQFSNIKLLK